MERIGFVDFAKGLAITWITLYHMYWYIYGLPAIKLFFFGGDILSQYVSALQSSLWNGVLRAASGLGYQGVSVFVIMSGLLQMWSHRNRNSAGKKATITKFIGMRLLRIYPLFWLAPAIAALSHTIRGGSEVIYVFPVWPVSASQMAVNLLGLQDPHGAGFSS